MPVHDLLGHRQSDARPLDVQRPSRGAARKLAKHGPLLGLRDARALVLDGDGDARSTTAGRHPDRGRGGRILDGVVHEVPERERQGFAVRTNGHSDVGRV